MHNTQQESSQNCRLIWTFILEVTLIVSVLGKEVLNGKIAVSLALSLVVQPATI